MTLNAALIYVGLGVLLGFLFGWIARGWNRARDLRRAFRDGLVIGCTPSTLVVGAYLGENKWSDAAVDAAIRKGRG